MHLLHSVIAAAKDWQTLIVGLAAVAVGWWTLTKIQKQITLQENQIDDERKRHSDSQLSRSLGARAKLPDALSRLCQYTQRCVAFVKGGNAPPIPDMPSDAINEIKAAVEFVDPMSARRLYELIAHYQIHNSRLVDHFSNATNRRRADLISDRILDAVYLRFLVNRAFEYARLEDADQIPDETPTRETMTRALHDCVGFEQFFDDQERRAPEINLITQRYPN